MDERFQHPFTCVVAGPTSCGKTESVAKFIQHLIFHANPNFSCQSQSSFMLTLIFFMLTLGWWKGQLVSFTPLCNKINITVLFLQSSVFNKICLPFYVSDNTSLRLLLPKVATTAKLFSLLISYFKDSLQLFFGHHTAPTVVKRNTTLLTNTSPVPQLVTDCVAKRHVQTCFRCSGSGSESGSSPTPTNLPAPRVIFSIFFMFFHIFVLW